MMRKMRHIHIAAAAAMLLAPLSISSCTAGGDLPCPIPEDKMNDPDPDWISFTVVNESCVSFCSLLIAPTRCDDWGLDWIGIDSLPPGEQRTVKVPAGRYDLLLEDCTQLEFIWEKIDITEASEFEVTGEVENSAACGNSVTVTNNADEAVCYMWIAAPHSESFGANWLGHDSIEPGAARKFLVPEGTYDLKAETCEFDLLRIEMDVDISGEVYWPVPE
jgi:hypothetical protein